MNILIYQYWAPYFWWLLYFYIRCRFYFNLGIKFYVKEESVCQITVWNSISGMHQESLKIFKSHSFGSVWCNGSLEISEINYSAQLIFTWGARPNTTKNVRKNIFIQNKEENM